ncbi:hypothetical protein EI546_00135 [Aequorivita sp. H23M31]|uniref:Glycerophosphoryl diester phosphodiesterase membrane domain-containing protein n=1 Tax=Aequorivita ciconiae TaxID=2494375 RepID=A0A451FS80_9FLAO|nr:hypothetical protein [Aequorivita sp. H23M31]QAA80234.1 hypothetical protein EI546_00135 [Aequorivita sp. H23M31]
MNEKIHFKQQRELGSILTDVFKFIRLNWKPLFNLIFKIAGPALVVLIAAYIYYMQDVFGNLGMLQSLESFENFGTTSFLGVLILFIAILVYYSLLNGVVLHCIKSYINNRGIIDKEAVTVGVKEDFWRLIGTSFLVGILTVFGMMFCVIPGIYLGVVFSIAFAIVVFEKKEVTQTISYCFTLIKGEWWITFANLLVIFLLYYFINFIFQVPQYIYFFIKGVTMAQEISANPAMMFDWVYILITSISLVFQYLLYIIIVLCTAFIYFNLNEKKNFTGTIETIESLGEREDRLNSEW